MSRKLDEHTERKRRGRVVVHYDTAPERPDEVETWMHCGKCLEEWKSLPTDARGDRQWSPKDYARQQVGIQRNGHLQIWCNRHECNVAILRFDFEEVH